jgi:hypothetical protein
METLKVPRVQFVDKPLSVWSVEAALHKLVREERVEMDPVATTEVESRLTGAIPTEAV